MSLHHIVIFVDPCGSVDPVAMGTFRRRSWQIQWNAVASASAFGGGHGGHDNINVFSAWETLMKWTFIPLCYVCCKLFTYFICLQTIMFGRDHDVYWIDWDTLCGIFVMLKLSCESDMKICSCGAFKGEEFKLLCRKPWKRMYLDMKQNTWVCIG